VSEFLFSVPSGEPVTLEPFHYAIVGQTQFSGKTTLIKRLAEWAVDLGFKVLIFDTKETEADYAGFGQEIPVCLRESKDSFVLIGLLESMFRRRLTPYYATLSRISEGAKDWDDIIKRAKEREEKTRSDWLKDACRILYDLLERLKDETAKAETVPKLELHPGINRMVINDFSLEAQQLIVKNSSEDLLRIYKRKAIEVLDEGHKFTPQGYSSPATRPVMHIMTQGGKTELYGWIATQFLATTDKGPLKACAFKFLGTQDHITEVKHTMDLIPEIRGKFTSDDIMKLKLGHWILVRKRPPDVRIVYSLPLDVPGHIGRKVAMGEMTPEIVRDRYLKVIKEEDEEMYRKLYETEKSKRVELEKEFTRQVERLSDLKAQEKIKDLEKQFADIRTQIYNELKEEVEKRVEEERQKAFKEAMAKVEEIKSEWNIEQLQKTIMELKDENSQLKEDFTKISKKAEAFDKLAEAIFFAVQEKLPTPKYIEPGAPSEMVVVTEQPALTIQKRTPPLTLNDSSLEGKIAVIYAEGKLPKDKWFTVTDVTKAFVSHGWPKDPRTSKVLNQFCQWGYLEKQMSGMRPDYRIKLSPEDARGKGLLKETEV